MDVYIVLCLGIVTKPCFKCAKLQALTKMNSQSSKDKNNVHVKTLFSFIKTFGYNVLWVNFELITKHITRKSRSNPWNFVFMRFAVEDSSKTFFFFFLPLKNSFELARRFKLEVIVVCFDNRQ